MKPIDSNATTYSHALTRPNQSTLFNIDKEQSPSDTVNPIKKDIQEELLNCLVHSFTIFKRLQATLLPNGPKQTQWCTI